MALAVGEREGGSVSEQADLEKVIAELEALEAKSCEGDINSAECGYARQRFRAALMDAWPALLAAAKRVAELAEALRPVAKGIGVRRVNAFATSEIRGKAFDKWPDNHRLNIDISFGQARAIEAALAKGGAA